MFTDFVDNCRATATARSQPDLTIKSKVEVPLEAGAERIAAVA